MAYGKVSGTNLVSRIIIFKHGVSWSQVAGVLGTRAFRRRIVIQ